MAEWKVDAQKHQKEYKSKKARQIDSPALDENLWYKVNFFSLQCATTIIVL